VTLAAAAADPTGNGIGHLMALPTRDEVLTLADTLDAHANHFVHRDWNYTRNLGGMEHIRYRRDYTDYNRFDRRLLRGVARLIGPLDNIDRMLGISGFRDRRVGFKIALRKPRNLPDGILDGGGVITFWEEVGEYLQFVQPSIGNLLVDLLRAHPTNPKVRAIAAEMIRIQDGYRARVEAGDVDGRRLNSAPDAGVAEHKE
jgi:hypothetical protein